MTTTSVAFRKRRPAWALAAFALVAPLAAKAATISTVAVIPGTNDGNAPYSALTKLDGRYYGITRQGGAAGTDAGTVFRTDLKAGTETILHSFNGTSDGANPQGDLLATGGKLYGTTSQAGSLGGGTVFVIDPTTGAEQVLYDLPAQNYAQFGLVAFHGLLYGTGRAGGTANFGFIFSVDPVAARGQVVYNFSGDAVDGGYPAGLTIRNDGLYGVTGQGGKFKAGTIFRFDPATATLQIEHSFGQGTDGSQPGASLTNVSGILYGTTSAGGTSGNGTVFSFEPEGRHETVLHAFDGTDGSYPSAGLLKVGGLFYGVTAYGGTNGRGVLFSLDPATDQTDTIHNFDYPGPFRNLIEAGGLLYGTLFEGGLAGDGTVYSVDPATGTFRTVYDFVGLESSTNSAVIKVGASLYGTASGGGSRGLGSIYKVDPATGALQTVYSFSGVDGAHPEGALLNVGGILYGTVASGGASGAGTVFSFGSASHRLTTLYQFTNGADGAYPYATLSQDDGALYGTTTAGHGTVFKVDLASNTFSTVLTFSGDQVGPYSGVTAVGGLLYGVAVGGHGELFQIDPATGKQTILHAFQGSTDGQLPFGGLVGSNGVLFGTTEDDRNSPATVFSFDLADRIKTTVFSSEKVLPQGPLVAWGDTLFGVAYARKMPFGSIFRLTPADGKLQLYPFAAAAGGYPDSSLLRVGPAYYGTTRSSDTTSAGTVFKFMP